MLPRTGAAAITAATSTLLGCAQCGLKRARVVGAAVPSVSSSSSSWGPLASIGGGLGQHSAGFSTAAKKDKKKGKGGGEEGGGGDASKNAWYIKMLDEAPGKGCVRRRRGASADSDSDVAVCGGVYI